MREPNRRPNGIGHRPDPPPPPPPWRLGAKDRAEITRIVGAIAEAFAVKAILLERDKCVSTARGCRLTDPGNLSPLEAADAMREIIVGALRARPDPKGER